MGVFVVEAIHEGRIRLLDGTDRGVVGQAPAVENEEEVAFRAVHRKGC